MRDTEPRVDHRPNSLSPRGTSGERAGETAGERRILLLTDPIYPGTFLLLLFFLLLSGCSFAPKYAKPSAQTPAAFKELSTNQFKETDGWKIAEPKEDLLRGKWWEMFADSQLNALE